MSSDLPFEEKNNEMEKGKSDTKESLKEKINKINDNAYQNVIKALSETIKEFNGEEIVDEEKFIQFFHHLKNKMIGMQEFTIYELNDIFEILTKKSPYGAFTGCQYINLMFLVHFVDNIEIVKAPIKENNNIGIKEKM